MPSDWILQKLSEVIEFNPKESIKKGQVAVKVAMENLQPFSKSISYFSFESFSGGSKFRNNDTIMARITPCLENGKTAFVSGIGDQIAFGSTEFIVLRAKPDKSDPNFVYYLAISQRIREIAIQSMVGTSGRQRAQADVIANYETKLPPLPEQKVIARILSSLDDKIELNNRMNKTLEEIAQTLFKRWFVDFEFPDVNGNPYRSSGGKMVDSELWMIPEGWNVGTVKDVIVPKRKAYNPSITLSEANYIGLEHMPRKSIALTDWGNSSDITSTKSCFDKGDILFGKLRPYFHKVGVAPISGICSTDILVLNSKGIDSFGFAVCLASSDAFVSFADMASEGTKMPRAKWSHMETYSHVIPPNTLLRVFNEIVKPALEIIISNIHTSRTLAILRDTLLPKLMSGEIRVSDN